MKKDGERNPNNKLRILQILLDVIAIVLIIIAVVYFVSQKEYTMALVQDPCRVCEEKTGGICTDIGIRDFNFSINLDGEELVQ